MSGIFAWAENGIGPKEVIGLQCQTRTFYLMKTSWWKGLKHGLLKGPWPTQYLTGTLYILDKKRKEVENKKVDAQFFLQVAHVANKN